MDMADMDTLTQAYQQDGAVVVRGLLPFAIVWIANPSLSFIGLWHAVWGGSAAVGPEITPAGCGMGCRSGPTLAKASNRIGAAT